MDVEQLTARLAAKIIDMQAAAPRLRGEDTAGVAGTAAGLILAALVDMGADPPAAREAVTEALSRWRADQP
ncbi:MAG: hypothetical protein ACRDZ4_22530 [Egibacteraceae bacterium]